MQRALAGAFVGLIVVAACDKGSSAPEPWQPDRSCTSNEECRPAPGCCPSPCTEDVINVRELPKAQSRLETECKRDTRPCPQAGPCITHKYLCVRGTCALVFEGSPDWPEAGAP